MAEKLNLGKVSITAEGAYNPSMSYDKLTCVFYNGVSWLSRKAVPTGVAPTEENSAYWQKMSDRGAQGVPGPQGPAGEGGSTEPQIINVELSEEYVTAIKKGYLNHDGVLRDPIDPIMLQGDLEAGRYTKIVANGTEVLAEGNATAMSLDVGGMPMTTIVYPTEFMGEKLESFQFPLVLAMNGQIVIAYTGLPYDSEIKIKGNEIKTEDAAVLKKYFSLANRPLVKVTRVTDYSEGGSSIRGIYMTDSVLYKTQDHLSLESQDRSLFITYDSEGKIQRVINHDMTPEAVYKAISEGTSDYYTKEEVNALLEELRQQLQG